LTSTSSASGRSWSIARARSGASWPARSVKIRTARASAARGLPARQSSWVIASMRSLIGAASNPRRRIVGTCEARVRSAIW
jgi:hypothetical protein